MPRNTILPHLRGSYERPLRRPVAPSDPYPDDPHRHPMSADERPFYAEA